MWGILMTWLRVRRAVDWAIEQARAPRPVRDDRGDILQTVVIVGLFVAAAIIIVGIIVAKAMDTANSIKTQ